jgi:hypothetical protein
LNKHVCPTNQKCAGQWNRQNQFHDKIIMKICQVTVVCIEKGTCRSNSRCSFSFYAYFPSHVRPKIYTPTKLCKLLCNSRCNIFCLSLFLLKVAYKEVFNNW